ncbi:MAG TPA: glycosyltransferase family 2 protein [Ferruginibacter sp.]|nr:glycosyltransferase family 2 protein [Ferruginibacter sp.]
MEKTIAVVVSYNRQKLLSECITALRNQSQKLDAILVVNNGSTDGTEEWLKEQSDIIFITQKNLGSSGGFNTGISWAFKNEYSWIWCMDDDGYPKEDALENILAAETDSLCLRNCAVINKEDKKTFVWKTKNFATIDDVNKNLIYGIGHPFNGTMLHRSIVERVGLPKANLFLWGDESEYYLRITRINNIPVCTVANSIHYHPAAAFTYKQDWDFNNSWKMYYYVRNRLHMHNAKFNNKLVAFINYLCFLLAVAGIVVVYQKTNKLKKLMFICWPAMDAISSDFSQSPATILQRLNSSWIDRFNLGLANYIRYSKQAFANTVIPHQVEKTANA